jgi:RpiB/LacA/LacB family sugar-phosphate isomerase
VRIYIGSDHAGFPLKEHVAKHLTDEGHEVFDIGTDSAEESVDYPDYGFAVAEAVADGKGDRGVLVCGTGLGIAIAANKVRTIRAVPVTDPEFVRLARRHNDANVVALAGRFTDPATADEIVDVFMSTPFEGGRHAARVGMLDRIDAEYTESC